MTTTDIRRIEAIPDTLRELDDEVYRRATEELGYDATSPVQRLYQLLLEGGVTPLHAEDVARYQRQAVQAKEDERPSPPPPCLSVWWPIGLVGLGLLVMLGAGLIHGLVAAGGLIALAGCVLLFAILIVDDERRTEFMFRTAVDGHTRWRWVAHDVAGYDGPVPAHVLHAALLAKAALGPQYETMRVEVFTNEVIVGDPFLVVYGAHAGAYIAVWDEARFPQAHTV